jgi:hypothetical protein
VSLLAGTGRRLERLATHAKGTAQRPLSEQELAAKFLHCAGRVPGLDARSLLARLGRLDDLGSARELLEQPPPARTEGDAR